MSKTINRGGFFEKVYTEEEKRLRPIKPPPCPGPIKTNYTPIYQMGADKVEWITIDYAAEVLAKWLYELDKSDYLLETETSTCIEKTMDTSIDFEELSSELKQEYINRAIEELKK